MNRRRERILAAAASVIARRGLQALNTRALAEAAGVTPPTLYNLIGSKEQILEALESAAIDRIEGRLVTLEHPDALDTVEAIVLESIRLITADTPFFRGAFIASYKLAVEAGAEAAREPAIARSVQVAVRACEAARGQKLLKGRVPIRELAEQMFICYRMPLLDWTFGRIELEEFGRRALRGFYLCLAADAVAPFQAELLRRLNALDNRNGAIAAAMQHAS